MNEDPKCWPFRCIFLLEIIGDQGAPVTAGQLQEMDRIRGLYGEDPRESTLSGDLTNLGNLGLIKSNGTVDSQNLSSVWELTGSGQAMHADIKRNMYLS